MGISISPDVGGCSARPHLEVVLPQLLGVHPPGQSLLARLVVCIPGQLHACVLQRLGGKVWRLVAGGYAGGSVMGHTVAEALLRGYEPQVQSAEHGSNAPSGVLVHAWLAPLLYAKKSRYLKLICACEAVYASAVSSWKAFLLHDVILILVKFILNLW